MIFQNLLDKMREIVSVLELDFLWWGKGGSAYQTGKFYVQKHFLSDQGILGWKSPRLRKKM